MGLRATRVDDLKRFYALLDELRVRVGGCRRLADCDAKAGWPERGVYFFFEDGERRSSGVDGPQPRVVRVGTHALKYGDETSLWSRLRSHRGVVKTGGGNHRGSIFRLMVGTALAQRDSGLALGTWGQGSTAPRTAPRDVREAEHALECRVSDVIRRMPVLWLDVPDAPGPNSLRAVVERNSIALLSNARRDVIDPASSAWLGLNCSRETVRRSGLWNVRHTAEILAVAPTGGRGGEAPRQPDVAHRVSCSSLPTVVMSQLTVSSDRAVRLLLLTAGSPPSLSGILSCSPSRSGPFSCSIPARLLSVRALVAA